MDEEAIFAAAIEHESPAERAAFLDGACGSDQQLRNRVDALLRSHEEAGTFLNEPAAPSRTLDQPITETPGTQIGPYKLLQQIGEGGMGVVYMAEQCEPVERRVALKIVKPGMDTRQVIARFEAEEQALAMMDHPNIAKVLDAGVTESGRPYFVMELVEGIPITNYCDRQRLAPRERLQLFIPICQAVQHAHQKGIIHRDIKPSNVLVALYDDQPVPKVIDFGVAKAMSRKLTEKTMFTQYGQIVGTLEYMSPEQADLNQLDIDTRSDVYSLGVLLYELLTGATPLDRQRLRSAAFEEMMRIIREEEPQRPSLRLSTLDTLPSVAANRHIHPKRLSALIRGDLDWIVMRTLEKDRSRRYESANGLAEDIERYLSSEPVLACPPSGIYRFRKFARRNRAILTTGAILFVALALGAAGTTWQAREAIRSRDRALKSERRALKAEDRAVKNLERALASVDKMLTRIADESLANVPFMEQIRRQLLRDALTIYQELLDSAADDPEIGLETAMAQRRLSTILYHLGRSDDASEVSQSAVELLTRMLQQTPDDLRLQHELARVRMLQSAISADNLATSRMHIEQATEILEPLVKQSEATRDMKADLAYSLSLLAGKLRESGERSSSRETFQRAEQVYAALLEEDDDRDQLIAYGKHLANWGGSYEDVGDWEGAEAKYRQAIEVGRTLLRVDQRDTQARIVHATAIGNVANVLWRQGRLEEAESLYGEALGILRNLVRNYPSFPDYRVRLSGYLMSVAAMYDIGGRPQLGIKHAEEAIERLEFLTDNWPTVRKYQSVTGAALSNLAHILQTQGNELERAERLARKAIEHQRRAIEDPQRPNLYLLRHYLVLATILEQRRNVSELRKTCDEAAEVAKRLQKILPDNPSVSWVLDRLNEIEQKAEDAASPAQPTDE